MYKYNGKQELHTLVTEMMSGDVAAAVNWCNNPKDFLGGKSPKEVWHTEEGQEQIFNFINNLGKGITTE